MFIPAITLIDFRCFADLAAAQRFKVESPMRLLSNLLQGSRKSIVFQLRQQFGDIGIFEVELWWDSNRRPFSLGALHGPKIEFFNIVPRSNMINSVIVNHLLPWL